eukprot:7571978-Alexandrium_andersonii.AAC.1
MNTQNRFRRSELELRGPRKDLDTGTRSSRGARSAPFFALIANLTTKGAALGVPKGFRGGSEQVPRGFRGGFE